MPITKTKHKMEFSLSSPQSSPEDLDFIELEIQDDRSESSEPYSCSDLDETDCNVSLSLNSNHSESLEFDAQIPKLPFWFGVEDPGKFTLSFPKTRKFDEKISFNASFLFDFVFFCFLSIVK
jgi:hypothetical protein